MAKVMKGRYTAQMDEPFVVFIIGMRINDFFQVKKWLPTARAMPPMLAAMEKDPQIGYLGGQSFMYWRGVGLIQYWRSFDDLENFARNPQEPHLSAWKAFHKNVSGDGTVGVWHETYMVQPGQSEAIYDNMPIFGLADATKHVKAVGSRHTARRRLGGDNEPPVEIVDGDKETEKGKDGSV